MDHNNPRILLVEDDDDMAATFDDRFKSRGFRLTVARDKDTALRLVDETTFHIAFVDIGLGGSLRPNLDGLAVIKHINALNEGTNVIVVTGHQGEQFVRDVIKEYGVFDFIHKMGGIAASGFELVFSMLNKALKDSAVDKPAEWIDTEKSIMWPKSERDFVSSCLTKFTAGFGSKRLQHAILEVYNSFKPLIRYSFANPAIFWDESGKHFEGLFWSKKLGHAIVIKIFPARTKVQQGSDTLYQRPGPPSIEVIKSEDAHRRDFGN